MRKLARFTTSMQDKVQTQVDRLRWHLRQAQRELEQARTAAVTAIGAANAGGADPEDLQQLRAAKDFLDSSLAGEELRTLEQDVEGVLPRTPAA